MTDDPLAETAQRLNKERTVIDGIGWWFDYVYRIETAFGYSERFVTHRLPMIKGWTKHAYAILNDPMNRFGGVKPVSGYIKAESDALVKQAKDFYAGRTDSVI